MEPRVHPLAYPWKWALLFVAALGSGAIAIGLVGLLDLPVEALRDDASTSRGELVVASVVGGWLLLFALTGLRRGQAQLDPDALSFLAFGPWCHTARVRLEDVVRFGHGTEKHGYRQAEILLLGLRDGGRHSIQVSMYEDWRGLVAALGEALGQAPAQTRRSLKGIDFV